MIEVESSEKWTMHKRQVGRWTGQADFEASLAKFQEVIRYFERLGWVMRPDTYVVHADPDGPFEQAYLWRMECVLLSPNHPDTKRLRGNRVDLKT